MNVSELLSKFPSLSALVVGDVCLDRWCTYNPALEEASRETGIPRIGIVKTVTTPGAAGTVANNLVALGVGRVAVLGAIGYDGFGVELLRSLSANSISSEYCVTSDAIQTFTYTKVINSATGIEDQPRLDFVNTLPLDGTVEQQILDNLRDAVSQFDVILVSDQAETSQGGVVTAGLRSLLTELAAVYPEKIFFVDSRARLSEFRGLTLKANEQEAGTACQMLSANGADQSYSALLRHTRSPLLLVTYGGKGVVIVDGKGETWVETRSIENPVDICGAGDSFSAGAALTLALTSSPVMAAQFGNIVASITIMKKGTGTASPMEVLAASAQLTN